MESEPVWTLENLMVDTRARVGHLEDEVGVIRQDVRRVYDRMFKLMLLQYTTIAGTLASIVASLLH